MILLFSVALAHTEQSAIRAPVARALEVGGRIARGDGTSLDVGESLEAGASLAIPAGGFTVVAHNGRLERWEGPSEVKIGRSSVKIELGTQTFVHPHVDDEGNSFTGEVRAPASLDQATSALGIPMSAEAWRRQDALDGGALHVLYEDALGPRLAAVGTSRERVQKLGLSDALPGTVSEQVELLGHYLDLAQATPDATLLLSLPPTDLDEQEAAANAGGILLDAVTGKRPHTFRHTDALAKIRVYDAAVADALRRRHRQVYALLVPYANTVENVVARNARPGDGAEVLHQVLVRAGGVDGALATVAVGYSQGAAALRLYLLRYGDSDGLDAAVELAPMGGPDGMGGEGTWAGRIGTRLRSGVASVGVMHPKDPARDLHARSLLGLLPRLVAFTDPGPDRDRSLHDGYYGGSTPLPHGVDREAALALGTHGYPIYALAPLLDALFTDQIVGEWRRIGDWERDNRLDGGLSL